MEQQEILAAPTGLSPGLHRPKQSNTSLYLPNLSFLTLKPLPSSCSCCSFLLFSLSGRCISISNAEERRIDWCSRAVYTILADIMDGERVLPSVWWISVRTKPWALMDLLSVTREGRTENQTSVTCTLPCAHHTPVHQSPQKNQSSCSQRLFFISCILCNHS